MDKIKSITIVTEDGRTQTWHGVGSVALHSSHIPVDGQPSKTWLPMTFVTASLAVGSHRKPAPHPLPTPPDPR